MSVRRASLPVGLLALALACGASPAIAMRIVPVRVTMRLGKSQVFRVRDAGGKELRWTVPGSPGRGIVDENGRYHSPFFRPTAREIVVRATRLDDSLQFAEARVAIGEGEADLADCRAAAAAPDTTMIVDRSPGVRLRVRPFLPDGSHRGFKGRVVVMALVCTNGLVRSTRVVESFPEVPGMDEAVVEAVRQWVFDPGIAPFWVRIPVRFALGDSLR